VRLPLRPTFRTRLALLLAAKGGLTVTLLLVGSYLLFLFGGDPVSRPDVLVEYGILLAALTAVTWGLAWLLSGWTLVAGRVRGRRRAVVRALADSRRAGRCCQQPRRHGSWDKPEPRPGDHARRRAGQPEAHRRRRGDLGDRHGRRLGGSRPDDRAGVPLTEQMLYRFASAGSGAAVSAGIAAVRRGLPAGTVLGAESWLTVKAQEAQDIAPWVPFLVTFGVIGLVMSVLIVVNVVGGAVVAGTRRIGVLKSVGFTPAQVVLVYVLQVAVPAVAGVALGVVFGNLLAAPVLDRTSQVFAVGPQSVPLWVDLAVPLAMLALAGIAALVPASRAGRLSAVQAIAAGRAPRPSHGYAVLRLLGGARVLPRPVTLGLAGPFARPGRTLVTFAAILFGALAVTFGTGLGSSLNRAAADLSRGNTEHVQIDLPGQQGPPGQGQQGQPAQPGQGAPSGPPSVSAVAAVIRAQPGTLHDVTRYAGRLAVVGMAGTASVTSFGGDASWIGYALISGHWYGAGGAVVNTFFLNATGKQVGDTFAFTDDGRSVMLKITGEVFQPGSTAVVLTNLSSVEALDPSGISPQTHYVGLRPGVNVQAYENAILPKVQTGVQETTVSVRPVISGLVIILTLLLVVVAGLGAANTVMLMTRERAGDLAVFKAVGMTPWQVIAMVVTTVAVTGLIAGLIAVPAGIALHQAILPITGNAAQTGFPPGVYNVYNPAELVLLALTGLVIAVVSALAPAGWAMRAPTAPALRAE
jgi:putative ABC transport system permease protein